MVDGEIYSTLAYSWIIRQ